MTRFKLFAAAAAATVMAGAAHAAPCKDTTYVAQELEARLGEVPAYVGVMRNANLVRVYLNPTTERWTIVVEPHGRNLSCLVATGRGADRIASRLQLDIDLEPV